jgi:transposase
VTDTLGFLLAVRVHPANVQDRQGGADVVSVAHEKCPTLKVCFADSAYAGQCETTIRESTGIRVEVVRRSDDLAHGVWQSSDLPVPTAVRGFKPLPKRWVVERAHAWTDRHRRMAKDFDQRCDVSEAWIWLAHGTLILRRLAEPGAGQHHGVSA